MKLLAINTESDPVKRVHIAYDVRMSGNCVNVYAVEDCFYPHPEAPTMALVQRIETRRVGEYHLGTPSAAPWFLLWNAHEAAKRVALDNVTDQTYHGPSDAEIDDAIQARNGLL